MAASGPSRLLSGSSGDEDDARSDGPPEIRRAPRVGKEEKAGEIFGRLVRLISHRMAKLMLVASCFNDP